MKKSAKILLLICVLVATAAVAVTVDRNIKQSQPSNYFEVATTTPVMPAEKQSTDTETDSILNDYVNSTFKVLNASRSSESNFILVLATPRHEEANNDGCGGLYTQTDCYFFIEGADRYGVDQKPKFLARYERGSNGGGALGIDTEFTFINDHTVEFEAFTGDAGVSIVNTVQLDLLTGELKEKRRKIRETINFETGETETTVIEF